MSAPGSRSALDRVVDYLAPLGLLVMVGALAWRMSERVLPGGFRWYALAGVLLMLAHLSLRWDRLRVGRRQLTYGTNAVVLGLVVLGILGAANYLAARHTKRWDLTKGQRYSLSDQTRKVVQGLKDDVKITYFARKADMAPGQDRMKEFAELSPRLKVEYVDPLASPGRARELDARGPYPMLVVERGSRHEKVSNDSEQDLTNALIKVTRDQKKTVCFAEGEGERDIEDGGDTGYTSAKGALTRSQYEIQKVALLHEGKVPEACTVFVVAGPVKDFLPLETEALEKYVAGGGKALVLVEPEMKEPLPNLSALLRKWNMETAHDIVVDVSPVGQLFGTGPLTPLVVEYPYHEITKDLRGVATAFHTARSLKAGPTPPAGVTTQDLLQTSPQSWAETDLTLKEPVEMDEGKDTRGPVSLGVVATVKVGEPAPAPSPAPSPAPEDKPRREGRVIGIGDADFASNALLGFQGNQDFFLNAVAWLSEDTDLISIRPREADDQRLFVTPQQVDNVKWTALILLPGLFVVLGVASWWRRR